MQYKGMGKKVKEIERQEQRRWKKFMEAEKKHYVQFMLERFLQNLISDKDFRQTVENLQNEISDEHFYMGLKVDLDILYKIEEQDDFYKKKQEFLEELENKLKEEYLIWVIDQRDDSRVYLIDNQECTNNLEIKYLIQQIEEKLDVELIYAVSESYHGIQGMKEAYIETRKLFDIEYEEGNKILIGLDSQEKWEEELCSIEIEKDILTELRRNDVIEMKKNFIRFIYSLSDNELLNKMYIHQLGVRTEVLLGNTYGLTTAVQKGYQDFYQAIDRCTDAKLADILYKLLQFVIREREAMVPEHIEKHEYIESACEYIRHHLSNEELSIAEVAEHVFLNQVYFGRLFKQVMNMSFKKYLLKTRLEHARQLLEDTEDSINDICAKVGMANPSYFSKLFKQEMGVLPSEYKRNQIFKVK